MLIRLVSKLFNTMIFRKIPCVLQSPLINRVNKGLSHTVVFIGNALMKLVSLVFIPVVRNKPPAVTSGVVRTMSLIQYLDGLAGILFQIFELMVKLNLHSVQFAQR